MDIEESLISFSPLIIGTMRLGIWGVEMSTQEYEKFIDGCVDLGLVDFDLADIYGHYTEENRFGAVLKRRPDLRQKLQITTKCGIKLLTPNRPKHQIKSYDTSSEHIHESVDNSLNYLGVEVIDVLLIHRPDYLMNPQEIAHTVEGLKTAGKIKHFGVSNFTQSQFELLDSHTSLVTNQLEISLAHTDALDDGTLDVCMKKGIRPTAWSPLGGGSILTNNENITLSTELKLVADKYNASIDQILLAFLLKHPAGILPVLGTTKLHRIESAIQAIDINLSREDWYRLLEASRGHEVP